MLFMPRRDRPGREAGLMAPYAETPRGDPYYECKTTVRIRVDGESREYQVRYYRDHVFLYRDDDLNDNIRIEAGISDLQDAVLGVIRAIEAAKTMPGGAAL